MSYKSVPQECPPQGGLTRVSHNSAPNECPTGVPHRSAPQECPGNSVPQECPTRVSHKSFPQECPTRVSHNSAPQECPTRVSQKSVLQEYPTRVSCKSVPLECPTRVPLQECSRRVSYRTVPQECPTEYPTRVSYKSVPQECPTRVSPQECPHKSVLQECPTTVSHKSFLQECPVRVSHKSFHKSGFLKRAGVCRLKTKRLSRRASSTGHGREPFPYECVLALFGRNKTSLAGFFSAFRAASASSLWTRCVARATHLALNLRLHLPPLARGAHVRPGRLPAVPAALRVSCLPVSWLCSSAVKHSCRTLSPRRAAYVSVGDHALPSPQKGRSGYKLNGSRQVLTPPRLSFSTFAANVAFDD